VGQALTQIATQNGSVVVIRIDHVIYAARDLEAAAARIEDELGLQSVAGGRHIGQGTHNRIVPLGNGYLEILAVAKPGEAAASDLGRALSARLDLVGEGLFGWAVAVDAVEPVADRLGLVITTIQRQGLRAHLAGLAESMTDPSLPFFISRDPGVADPAAGGEVLAGDAGGITGVGAAGDPDRLDRWLNGYDLPVRMASGTGAVRAVGIGNRELRTAARSAGRPPGSVQSRHVIL
jgi:hypothetical protein